MGSAASLGDSAEIFMFPNHDVTCTCTHEAFDCSIWCSVGLALLGFLVTIQLLMKVPGPGHGSAHSVASFEATLS